MFFQRNLRLLIKGVIMPQEINDTIDVGYETRQNLGRSAVAFSHNSDNALTNFKEPSVFLSRIMDKIEQAPPR